MTSPRWDFFIAHAGKDGRIAEDLYKYLSRGARVFLDSRCLELGDDWDSELGRAQRNSLITVVLVSSQTERAYYQREEVAAAIALAREDETQHRVVPIFLDAHASQTNTVPYGLRIKHGLVISDELDLERISERLLGLLKKTHVESRGAQHSTPQKVSDTADRNRPFTPVDPWGDRPASLLKTIEDSISNGQNHNPIDHWKCAVLLARLHRVSEANYTLAIGDNIAANVLFPERHLYAGFIASCQGNLEDAEHDLRRYLAAPKRTDRDEAVAWDVLAQVLKRKPDVMGAADAYRNSIEKKRRLEDAVGLGISLGNLGRLLLYQFDAANAKKLFEENIRVISASPDISPLGIARNNLSETQMILGQRSVARRSLRANLNNVGTGGNLTRAFAQTILAEIELLDNRVQESVIAISKARESFEKLADTNGVALCDELEGVAAMACGWMATAAARFSAFDELLKRRNDPIFAIYRWRRRAVLAALFENSNILRDAMAQARQVALQNNLPLTSEIDQEFQALQRICSNQQPPHGLWSCWTIYWARKLPRPLIPLFPSVIRDHISIFRFVERFVELCVIGLATSVAEGSEFLEQASRSSFGMKVSKLRELSVRNSKTTQAILPNSRRILRTLDGIVAVRNHMIHGPGEISFDENQMAAWVVEVAGYASEHLDLVIATQGSSELKSLRGTSYLLPASERVVLKLGSYEGRVDEWFQVSDEGLMYRNPWVREINWMMEDGTTIAQ